MYVLQSLIPQGNRKITGIIITNLQLRFRDTQFWDKPTLQIHDFASVPKILKICFKSVFSIYMLFSWSCTSYYQPVFLKLVQWQPQPNCKTQPYRRFCHWCSSIGDNSAFHLSALFMNISCFWYGHKAKSLRFVFFFTSHLVIVIRRRTLYKSMAQIEKQK